MKPENPLLLREFKKILESSAEATARKEKLLAADRARAAQVLSAISFRLGSQVESITETRKSVNSNGK